MAETPASIVSDYLRRVAAEEPGDAELLARFAASKDGEAFAMLVRRHGPMVLGVCRRGAGDAADDAFQGTFLALARQAGRVRERLPGWLHRVATRIARRSANRRSHSLREAIDAADAFAEVEWKDLRAALDVELAALPSRLRTPLILCYLDGLARDEAASRLACSLRTLHRRLDEGRQRLRDRLTRRGLAPVMLGAAALSVGGLRAAVSSDLCRGVTEQATGLVAASAAVEQLLTTASGIRGTLMKSLVALAVIAGGLTAVISVRQPAAADTPPAVRAGEVARAQRNNPPPADPLAEKVRKSKTAAVAWLVKQQREDGSWEKDVQAANIRGGHTALAVLALLETGLKPDDATVKLGLKSLRGLKPHGTYVVSLQTEVLCRTNEREDAEIIKANVKWLEATVIRDGRGNLAGWSYGIGPAVGEGDNSNTRYAVSALYAAHKAGSRVERMELWNAVRDYFLRTQSPDGAWGYTRNDTRPRQTMTCSGLLCLAQAEEIIGKKQDNVTLAMKNGFAWLDAHYQLENSAFQYYFLDVLSQIGMITHRDKFGDGDQAKNWRREGREWLVKNQRDDGRFQGNRTTEGDVISTAFALRFLHAQGSP